MSDPIAASRRPVVPDRLLEALELGMAAPIQTVRAGAGWGKTTVLRRWLEERDGRGWVVWTDLSPTMKASDLAKEIVFGVRSAIPSVGPMEGAGVASADPAQLGIWAARMLSAVTSPGVVVFDDVDAALSPSAIEFLATFLTRLPDSCHVVLSGRRIPAQLETHLGVAFAPALLAANLQLTEDETHRTIEALLGAMPSDEEVADVYARTDGWAAGIMTSVRIAQDPARRARLDSRELHTALGTYFEREVLSQVSLEARRLMLEMSAIGEDVHQSLLRALTGTDSTRALAGALETMGGFLTIRGGGERTYHLLRVLADYLREQFEQSQPARARALHRRGAAWFEDRGDISSACRHAIAAGEVALAIRLCGHYWLSYARSGREGTIRLWLEWVRAAAGPADVTVAFIRGWLGGMHGRTVELERSVEVLAARPDARIAGGPPTARAGLLILRAAFIHRVGAQGAEDARKALAELEEGSVWWTIAECLLGYHLYWAGDLDEARDTLTSGLATADRAFVPVAILQLAYGTLGLIDASRRYAPGARENAAEALKLTEASSVGITSLAIPALVAQALGDAAAGRFEAATAELDRAVRTAERHGNSRNVALAYLATSRVRHLRGDRAGAASMLRAVEVLLDDLPEATVLHAEAEMAARMMRLRPRRVVARPDEPTPRELRVLELLAAGLSRSSIADELGVSTDTVKTHIRNLYLKLDADSRDAAIEHAQSLGILPTDATHAPVSHRAGNGSAASRAG